MKKQKTKHITTESVETESAEIKIDNIADESPINIDMENIREGIIWSEILTRKY